MTTGRHHRGGRYGIGQFVKRGQCGIEFRERVALVLRRFRRAGALAPADGIELRREFGHRAGADVPLRASAY